MAPTEINDMAKEVTTGRMLGAQTAKMMRRTPLKRPADPMPLTARPMINMWLDLDTAHIILPNSKTIMKEK